MAAEDIEYRQVVSSDSGGITDTKRGSCNRLQLCLCIVLTISAVFQFIAIATPGWMTFSTSRASLYQSVFYSTLCLNSLEGNETGVECETTSSHDAFQRKYDAAGDASKPAIVRTYNLVVQNQVNVQIAWLLTVGTIVFQVFKLARPKEGFPRLTVINIIALACVCSLMFHVLYKGFIEVDFQMTLIEYITGDVGFPYSLLFYCITFIQTIACLVLIVKQHFDQLRMKDQIHAETNVKFDRVKLEYEAEVEAFNHYRRKAHLRPESGGSYRGDRRSRGEDGRSHSPRHSPRPRDRSPPRAYNRDRSPRPRDRSPPREYDRDRSPRPRDRSPPREYDRDRSPRPRDRSPPREYNRDRSPRPRDRSPPREYNRDRSPRPRDRSPPREYNRDRSPRPRNHSPRQDHRSSPRFDRVDHSRHRSPPRENHNDHSPRQHSPPSEEAGKQSARDPHDYDNPALVVTPPVEVHPVTVSLSQDTSAFDQSTPSNDNSSTDVKEESEAKTDDIELNIVKL